MLKVSHSITNGAIPTCLSTHLSIHLPTTCLPTYLPTYSPTNQPIGRPLTLLNRMGWGFIFAVLAMIVAGVMEINRKHNVGG